MIDGVKHVRGGSVGHPRSDGLVKYFAQSEADGTLMVVTLKEGSVDEIHTNYPRVARGEVGRGNPATIANVPIRAVALR